MAQLNLNTTPEFERDLEALMKARNLKSKSEAIRLAVREARAAQPAAQGPRHNLSALIGLIHQVPGPNLTNKTGQELLAEIDAEMEEKLDRLARPRK